MRVFVTGATGLVGRTLCRWLVEQGRAVAVKVYFADGEALAYCQYEVFSPADPKIPYQKGRTDRNGYLAFVPDAAGRWRVKVVDSTGHGFDTEVDVASSGAGGAAPADRGGWRRRRWRERGGLRARIFLLALCALD